MRRLHLAAVFAVTAGLAGEATAVTFELEHILDPPEGSVRTPARFGGAVALFGDTALIGAASFNRQTGVAYLFDTLDGDLIDRFPNGSRGSFFGGALAIDAEHIVIGAFSDDNDGLNVGRAFVFDRQTRRTTLLRDPTPSIVGGDNFGAAAAVNGGEVLIGARNHDSAANSQGEAHLFNAETGALIRTFSNPNPDDLDQFGFSVDMNDNWVLIGAHRQDVGGVVDIGRVYVYDRATGDLIHTLEDPTPSIGDRFGAALSLDGDLALIGAPGDRSDPSAQILGQVHVFDLTDGELTQTISNPVLERAADFGGDVALDGGLAVVAAADADGLAGRVDVFDATTGLLLQSLFDVDPDAVRSGFGSAISLRDGRLLIGSALNNATGFEDGRAFLYSLEVAAVPAPSALVLLLSALGVIGAARLRRG